MRLFVSRSPNPIRRDWRSWDPICGSRRRCCRRVNCWRLWSCSGYRLWHRCLSLCWSFCCRWCRRCRHRHGVSTKPLRVWQWSTLSKQPLSKLVHASTIPKPHHEGDVHPSLGLSLWLGLRLRLCLWLRLSLRWWSACLFGWNGRGCWNMSASFDLGRCLKP